MSITVGMIAAGHGSRLAASHPNMIKPLVPIAGRPLACWVIDGLRACGTLQLTILTNSRGKKIPEAVHSAFPEMRLDSITADTASSFESFRLVSLLLAEQSDRFLITTADALIPGRDIARFWNDCGRTEAEAGLALTRHVDDEKPLWADLSKDGLITGVGDKATRKDAVTCGLYYMTRSAARRLPAAAAYSRLRDYWAELVASGTLVAGSLLSKTIDVDRPEDLAAAENFITQGSLR